MANPLPSAGLMVLERNWLEVYPWGNWGGNANLPTFQQGQTFMPTELLLKEGATQPPPRLSERDLIAAMERYGIGALTRCLLCCCCQAHSDTSHVPALAVLHAVLAPDTVYIHPLDHSINLIEHSVTVVLRASSPQARTPRWRSTSPSRQRGGTPARMTPP
jgi:hypothetical protein